MASEDVIERVRRVVAGLRMPEDVSLASRHVRQMAGVVAMPALLRLAEAVGRLVADGSMVSDSWWVSRSRWEGYECSFCGADSDAPHALECPALAIDAALADLAALGGEVTS